MTVYHYSRVSLDEQEVSNQILVASRSGYDIADDNYYSDEGVSGAIPALSRPEFTRLVSVLREGDVVVVSTVDRIGRDTIDVLSTLDILTAKGVKVCVLTYGNLDLTSDMGRVIVTMAAAFAQLERSYLKARTRAGMARTKAQGTKLGQPLTIRPETLSRIVGEMETGAKISELSRKYNIPRNTLQRNIDRWGSYLEGYEREFEARQEQYKKAA